MRPNTGCSLMMICKTLVLSVFALAVGSGTTVADDPPRDFSQWEAEIAAFEAADHERPPQPGGMVFYGSSTMRMWDTAASFPDLPVANRGFGGSQMQDAAHFVERVVLPHQPRVVVVYAGSNDLAQGRTPCEIQAAFVELATKVHAALPETQVVFLSIKPTTARWHLIHRIRAVNALVEATCIDTPETRFLNVHPAFLTAAGEPDPQYLADDGLHLTRSGYAHLTEQVRPVLEELLTAQTAPQ
jgi:lysophospholipase L1-like esterase